MKADGRLVCGLLDTSREAGDPVAARRARDLTVSWVRWGYFGDIFEGTTVDALLTRATDAGYDYCLIQAWGHILIEDASPNGGKSTDFFSALHHWISRNRFVLAGVPGRCLVANLSAWHAMGRPSASKLPITSFGPELAGHLLDLKTDLSAGGGFLDGLKQQCEKASRGVFVLNYESYRDVEEPPPGFRSPVSAIYSVAAGLKPNRILQTHGFDAQTRVVFYDYSRQGLAFRRLLRDEWDGRDYPRFLRDAFARMPSGSTHYYLWPGATPENLDWSEMERLWAGELARWGGQEALAEHWSRFRELRHDYILCNVLSSPEELFAVMEDRAGSVIWWSNAFATVFSATHYSLEEKRDLYERWIRGLATTSPQIFIYGSDHTNSSVNGLTAADYWERYRQQGGDPLLARRFQRHEIRF